MYLQGHQCSLSLSVNITNETPNIPLDTSQLIESAPAPISTSGINLIGVDGEVLQLKGANWFGFEQPVSTLGHAALPDSAPGSACRAASAVRRHVPLLLLTIILIMACSHAVYTRQNIQRVLVQATMLDGLFEGSATITGDYAAVLYRLQLLGFNAIRVPFSFQVGELQHA